MAFVLLRTGAFFQYSVIQSVSKIVNSLIQIEETRAICEKKERSTFHVSES